ncbi:MAG: M23 family metallopeptidase [Bacteroidales bacterium]|nr:M23 family metallopeptidase [Bacteroidales bacterium]
MNWKRILMYFLASISLAVIYYVLGANIIYFGDEARLLKENRVRAKYLDTMDAKFVTLNGNLKSLQERDAGIYRSIFGADPAKDLYREDVGQDIDLATALAMARDVEVSIDSIRSNLSYLGSSQENIPSIIPVEGCGIESISASLGRKMNPLIKSVVWHSGVDISAEAGSKVIAPAEGVVTTIMRDRTEGDIVELDHLNGYTTRYCHLDSIAVKRGDTLSRGDRIACVGLTGKTIAPHLHYEVLFNGKRANPVCWFFASLKPEEYSHALHKAENSGQSLD